MNKKDRIGYFDIAKGIGIILVVWAHAHGPFRLGINKFHMPYFMLISGMLYNLDTGFRSFLQKKIKSLYIPFVFWNLLSLWIKNIPGQWDPEKITVMFKETAKVLLTLSIEGECFGATWFIASLLVISVFYKAVQCVFSKFRHAGSLRLILFIIIAIIGFYHTLPYTMSRTLVLSLFFATGVFIREKNIRPGFLNRWYTAVLSMILFIVISGYYKYSFRTNTYSSPLLFVAGALLASYPLLYFSVWLERMAVKGVLFEKCGQLLEFLGRRSMDILIWQFVFFRLVIILQMILNSEMLTLENIRSYYPVYSEDGLWWLAYLAVGLVCPLVWCDLLRKDPWGKNLKKIHIV